MRVLFAVSTDSISRSIINKYQGMYKQILSAKSVYYFDAIVKELQRDKTYDRVVISEDLEPHTDNNYERIDNNIFNKLDRITDEASNVMEGEIPIIIIGADRRTKADPLLTKLFGIGIYNVLLGQDRSLEDVCTLINKPRTKKEAKLYYNISDVSNVTYAPEAEDTVPEEQIQSILNHFNKVGKNEPVIISSFNSIADQYSSEQLKIIIKHLPLQVRAVLETSSDRYKEFVTSEQGQSKKNTNIEEDKKPKRKGLFSRPSKAKGKDKYVPNRDTVINNNYVPNAVTNNNVEVIPIEPINNALNNNENVGNVIIPRSVNINSGHSAPSYNTDNNGIMVTESNVQNTVQSISTNNEINTNSSMTQQSQSEVNAAQQSVPAQTVEPQSAPNVEATMPGLFDEVEETPSAPAQTVETHTAPSAEPTMPGLFDEVEETTSAPSQTTEPQSAPSVEPTMPGLFDEVEETPSIPEQTVEPQSTPSVEPTMPGLFDEVEETASAPAQTIEPQTAPSVEATMPGLFDEVEETTSIPEQTAEPQSAPSAEATMPGLFDEVEETPSIPVQNVEPQSEPNAETTMPGLFDEAEEETTAPEKKEEVSNLAVNEGVIHKRGRGRPRKYPKVEIDPNAPKRGRGRPRKAVSLNIGAETTVISETVKLADNAEFQIHKPENILKESISQNLSSKYAINTFNIENTMSQNDIFNFGEEEKNEPVTETPSENVIDEQNNSISETIPGLFDDVTTENSEVVSDTIEIDVPSVEQTTNIVPETHESAEQNEATDETTMPEPEVQTTNEHVAAEAETQTDELPGLFDNIESMDDAQATNEPAAAEAETQEDELPGLFDNMESMDDAQVTEEPAVAEPETQTEELPGLFDNIESMDDAQVTEEPVAAESETQTEELPGLFDNIESMDDAQVTEEPVAAEPETQTDELPGLFDNMESMDDAQVTEEPVAAEPEAQTEELPGLFDNVESMEETQTANVEQSSIPEPENDSLPGLITESEELDNAFVAPQQVAKQIEEFDINTVLNGTNKLVAFVGTQKNGTSFVVNNLATLISQNNVDVAILDLTRNKDSYYVFTNNDPELMKKGKKCIEKLIEGFYEGIQVQNNLTIYTSLPGEEEKFENVQAILGNLLKKYSLVILDCDFDTIPAYFKASQEIYLVQTYDILTIQPLTKFLRDSLEKGIISVDKLRIVINKELKMKKLTKSLLIGGISTYNDPGLDYMKELFDPNMVMATSIPFDVDTYETYLENMVDCKISLRGYSNDFKQALAVLANMVYPLSTSRMQNNAQRITRQNDSNNNNDFNKMNDTLSKMRNNF